MRATLRPATFLATVAMLQLPLQLSCNPKMILRTRHAWRRSAHRPLFTNYHTPPTSRLPVKVKKAKISF